MSITLGYSRQSQPSALRIAEASQGRIVAVRGDGDINWGRRTSTGLNADITNSVNKRAMRVLFVEHGVPHPELLWEGPYGSSPGELLDAYNDIDNGLTERVSNDVWVGRPDLHTRGRGFWIVRDAESLKAAMFGTRRKPAATHFFRYIATTEAPKEFRVHVFKGGSLRISQKKYQSDDRKDYTTVKPDPDLPKRFIRRAAKAAVAALGLDFGTVDMLASDDQRQVWVLEVNAAPGLGGSMPKLWAQTFINHFQQGES